MPPDAALATERDRWLTIPNLLTLARFISIIPFVVLSIHGNDRGALILFFLVGLTDTLDGTIARRFGQTSRIGRLLDPLADKLFTGIAFISLSLFRHGLAHIPVWITVAVLARDVLILGGSFVVYRLTGNSGFRPSLIGKWNTFVEIGVVVIFLAQPGLPSLTAFLPFAYVILVLFIVISAGDYIVMGIRMVRKNLPQSA